MMGACYRFVIHSLDRVFSITQFYSDEDLTNSIIINIYKHICISGATWNPNNAWDGLHFTSKCFCGKKYAWKLWIQLFTPMHGDAHKWIATFFPSLFFIKQTRCSRSHSFNIFCLFALFIISLCTSSHSIEEQFSNNSSKIFAVFCD